MNFRQFAVLSVVLLTAGACSSRQDEPAASPAEASPYAFDRPDASSALPEELTEISGMAALDDGRLAAIQDEDGILFVLDPATGAVVSRMPFGDGGDYEGVELAGERLFVLRSNGNLLELAGWRQGTPEVRDFKTDLKGRNDTEGLAYDRAGERLLVVTKEEPGAGLDEDRRKAIYAFDLQAGTLAPEPALQIDLDAVEAALPGVRRFMPSALAVHPGSGEVYVLSSNEQAIVVLGADGGVRQAWRLSPSLFEQPEGLAFSPNGDLYVSSEGVDGPGMLYRFSPGR